MFSLSKAPAHVFSIRTGHQPAEVQKPELPKVAGSCFDPAAHTHAYLLKAEAVEAHGKKQDTFLLIGQVPKLTLLERAKRFLDHGQTAVLVPVNLLKNFLKTPEGKELIATAQAESAS